MIYFPHIPKAGGSTLKQVLNRNLGAKNCISNLGQQSAPDFTAKEFPSLGAKFLNEKFAVFGHLNVTTAFRNSIMADRHRTGNLLVLSSVRDPVDRIISLFNFIRANKKHWAHSKLIDQGFEGFVEFCKNEPSNFQYHFLKKTGADTVNNILDDIIVFALSDSVNGFSSVLSLLSGLPTKEYGKANVTAERASEHLTLYKKSDLPTDLLADIVKANNLDYQLYQRSQSNFDEKIFKASEWIEYNSNYCNKVRNWHSL